MAVNRLWARAGPLGPRGPHRPGVVCTPHRPLRRDRHQLLGIGQRQWTSRAPMTRDLTASEQSIILQIRKRTALRSLRSMLGAICHNFARMPQLKVACTFISAYTSISVNGFAGLQ